MKNRWFKVTNITSSVPTAAAPRTYVKSTMYGKGDPGYLATAGEYFISCHASDIHSFGVRPK
jgi:hypothetical protein